MKIVVNARFLTQPVSGVQRYGIECSRQIKKLYNEVIFVTPADILHQELSNELRAIPIGHNTGHLWEQLDLPHFLKKMGSPPLLNLANTGPVFYKNNFVTIHDLAFHFHPEWNSKVFATWYNMMVPALVNRSRHVFTVSNTVKNELMDVYKVNAEKITVTYNGLQTGLVPGNKMSRPGKEKLILCVGTLNIRKNQHGLIAAFLQSSLKKDYKLVLAGGKHRSFAGNGINEKELEDDNIIIRSDFTNEELVKLYLKAAVNVSVSFYEGFGIPVLEGLAFDCITVCSDIKVYRELYSNCAYFCDPGNISSITAALEKACSDNKKMEGCNPEHLLLRFSYEKAARQILEVIERENK